MAIPLHPKPAEYFEFMNGNKRWNILPQRIASLHTARCRCSAHRISTHLDATPRASSHHRAPLHIAPLGAAALRFTALHTATQRLKEMNNA